MEFEVWFAELRGLSREKKIRLRKSVAHAKEIYFIRNERPSGLGRFHNIVSV